MNFTLHISFRFYRPGSRSAILVKCLKVVAGVAFSRLLLRCLLLLANEPISTLFPISGEVMVEYSLVTTYSYSPCDLTKQLLIVAFVPTLKDSC